ncbi:CLUMA_CG005069, isoform A [Clunio marinus]|uniref:CLUMA_CG005069, isoform A n=1 Tax=Clunio marinus TaxID=568069 RepID=A0A1J1HVK9_9DIPT|nr:CLUMA_CG005069, isoform A [Clunio marinus]
MDKLIHLQTDFNCDVFFFIFSLILLSNFDQSQQLYRGFLLQLARYLDEKVDSANIFIENERNEDEEEEEREKEKSEQETCSYKAFALHLAIHLKRSVLSFNKVEEVCAMFGWLGSVKLSL